MELIKAGIKRIAKRFGFRITRISKMKRPAMAQEYEPVLPSATYSPWNKDNSFQEVHASIAESTLVDRYRCFELWKLVEQVSKLKEGSIIEVGVWRGGTGALIAKKAKDCGIEDRVFLCDTFTGVVKAGVKDSVYEGGEHANTSRRTVEKLISTRMKLDNVEILEGIFPEQTGHRVEDMKFRFCHVDVDVYQSAKEVVDWIWDKMVPGGIVVYDDYGFDCCDGIVKYVEEQMMCEDRIVIHNLNGHAIVLKR
jgi:O-methyltransferase